jgi:cathepsin C
MGDLSKRRMTLNNPNTVSAEDGSTGTWTMIYDEGFEVAVGDLVYFAFSKFEFTDLEKQHNVSRCDATQIGWYHDALRSKWGCYVGKKVTADTAPLLESKSLRASQVVALQSFGSATDDAPSFAEPPRQHKKPRNTEVLTAWLDAKDDPMALMPDEPSEDTSAVQVSSKAGEDNPEQSADSAFMSPPEFKPWVPGSAGFDKPMDKSWQQTVVNALNFLQLGWTASAYDQFHGKTPHELNKLAGVRRNRLHEKLPSHTHAADSKESFTSFLGIGHSIRHQAFEDDQFDWRKKDGQNWLTPVVTQGDCGSCYTISTVHMLTARNRIRKGSLSEPSFSVSFPLYCSEYNQGCDGGYGFLQSKWTEDVGLIPEHCAPFSQGGGSCQVASDCNLGDKRYRATRHHYVGGYYGGSDADSIRTELVEHGPLVMSFEPKEDFMYYKDGIYKSSPNKIHQEWEQVDHAVLLIGYGKEKNAAYWTMQNSWGDDWGENGYFRMARGSDESGCESIVVSADVVEESSNPILDDFLATL